MSRFSVLVLAAAATIALNVQAKPAYVAKAKAINPEIKGCISCHGSSNMAELMKAKGEPYGDLGKYLKERKASAKAAEVDLNWIKDYKPKK
jgi:cytochrome c553